MGRTLVIAAAAAAAALSLGAALSLRTAAAQQFREGECSGILCSTIGGSQAPQNQPRKSLFPEGQCGGVLCSAIGGSQAPQHTEPPPSCGGGLLCDMAPYAIGQPFVKPQPAAVVAAPPPAPVADPAPRRKTKPRKRTAAAK